jgi:hypothetical protein
MALSEANRAEMKSLYLALHGEALQADDPQYVAELNLRTASGTDAVTEMATEIDFQVGGGVCLFTGQRGTGKSTELLRLQERLEGMGIVTYYADMSQYVLLTKPIEISDFLIAVAGAISDQVEADPRIGKSPSRRSYWDRLAHFLQSTVEFKELGFKLEGGLELKASLKNDPDFKQLIQRSTRGHVARLVRDAHEFLAQTVLDLREHLKQPNLEVALIIDSIERLRGVGDEAMDVFESVRNLFLGHAEHLRIPMLHMVYTVPPYLPVLAAGAGTLIGGASIRRLVNTHIFKDRSRDVDDAGVKVMKQVALKRHLSLERIFQDGAIRRLAVSSGGDLREFFRLLRQCLPAVRDDVQLPLSAEAVAHVETAARAEMLPIPADQLSWLKQISTTHDTCLQSDSKLPMLAHFLDNRLVMNYRNGSDWYDVHPLIRAVVDAHVSSGTAA